MPLENCALGFNLIVMSRYKKLTGFSERLRYVYETFILVTNTGSHSHQEVMGKHKEYLHLLL